jgi:catechol 2,3-dioxygenase-like lactoylglutathione lyase family enzyme
MGSFLYHLQVNTKPENATYYKNLMTFLGWTSLYDGDDSSGYRDRNGTSLWFVGAANDASYDYDGVGVNHISIGVDSIAEVDRAMMYLTEQGQEALFETPRHRPDFAADESSTYYQVMFRSPDNLLFEVVYVGPKES